MSLPVHVSQQFFSTFSMDEHDKRDGTSQRNKTHVTFNAKRQCDNTAECAPDCSSPRTARSATIMARQLLVVHGAVAGKQAAIGQHASHAAHDIDGNMQPRRLQIYRPFTLSKAIMRLFPERGNTLTWNLNRAKSSLRNKQF